VKLAARMLKAITQESTRRARAVPKKAKTVAIELKIKKFKEVAGRWRRVLRRH